ncbi:extracellular solute-binding protein [Paenibacillus hemerocallicola]|uniref:Extracellular solute-binding protein n=2 Tax=Paenibacillus hemerocallicola TaxID=1172614 RepID=A0A5C4TFF0_9BACL|nr:extracellular solute-binding protein [Paenibacillus hemerocallicola]
MTGTVPEVNVLKQVKTKWRDTRMMKHRLLTIGAALVSIAVIAGCGEKAADKTAEKVDPVKSISTEPVTLKATSSGISIDENYLNTMKDLIKKHHPNITLDFIQPGKSNELTDMIAAGNTPDLVFTHTGMIVPLQANGILYDLNPLVKQHKVDLNRFDKPYLDDVYMTSTKGELFALPLYSKYHALYYNKSLFDKFGAPYPKDGMTMNETVELAKRVSRVEGATTYRGLNTGSNIIWIAQPLSLFTVDGEKPIVNTDGWRKMFDFGKTIYSIPGNSWTSVSPRTQFLKEQTLSMFLFQNLLDELSTPTQEGLNWDVVQYPSFPENPNVYPSSSTDVVMITSTSKYKEQALQVLNVLTSDEIQLMRSRQGVITVLSNPEIKKAFGTEIKFAEGKNLPGILKSKPALSPPISAYRQAAEGIVRRKFEDYLNNVADVNSILRMAEEEINKLIATEKSK